MTLVITLAAMAVGYGLWALLSPLLFSDQENSFYGVVVGWIMCMLFWGLWLRWDAFRIMTLQLLGYPAH